MLNNVEMKKVVLSYWNHIGYNASKIKDNQIFVLYMKYQKQIEQYIKDKARKDDYIAVTKETERDQWTDAQWNDYAFEEY